MAKDHRHALPEGIELGDHLIEGVLGAGGFGITYKAVAATGEPVAIKEYLPRGLAARERDGLSVEPVTADDTKDFGFGLDRFRKESMVLSRFDHPNIVRVRGFFEANGTAYLVMNYVEGETLFEILERDRTMGEGRARRILEPLLDGLEQVHAAKFLHRDIKPGNIFVQADGTPVLIDFGAARQALDDKSQSYTSIVTAGYAPPEQYHRRGRFGPWTDIYALGATVYRCVTGEKPPPAVERVMADDYVPAGNLARDNASPAFLRALDSALELDEDARPKTIAAWRPMLDGEAGPEETERTRPVSHGGKAGESTRLPPARPRKRPGARPALSDAAPAQAVGSWRRWGTTVAALAALAMVVSVVSVGGLRWGVQERGEGVPRAVEQEKRRAEAERKRGAEQGRKRAEEAERKRGAEEGRKRRAEEARRRADEEARRRAKEEARRRAAPRRRVRPKAAPSPPPPGQGGAGGGPGPRCRHAVPALQGYYGARDCIYVGTVLKLTLKRGLKPGAISRWGNRASASRGTVTFVKLVVGPGSRRCWQIKQTLTTKGKTREGAGLVCRLGAGPWVVRQGK